MPEISPNNIAKFVCVRCGAPLVTGRKYCSVFCKNESQKKCIRVICNGCSKVFSILPYLERSTNYCSLKCYRDSTRRKRKRICAVCGKVFWIKAYLIKKGFGFYCSRECQFKDYPERINKFCLNCKKKFSVWPSKVDLAKFCSKKCADDFMRDYVECVCKNCQKPFQVPRSDLNRGRGTFCSRYCFYRYKGESSLEEKMRGILTRFKIEFVQEYKIGRYYADFFISKLNLIVECDGEYWHLSKIGRDRDRRKDKYLCGLGYKVVRFTGSEIKENSERDLLNVIVGFE